MAAKFYDSSGEVQVEDAKPNAPVAVYDPDSKSLRAVDKNTAAQLAAEGYAIGPEAQGQAIRESAGYKLAGFAAKAGEAGSMGLSDLASVALGNRAGLQEKERFTKENPYTSGAASLLGYGASYGLGAGRLGIGAAEKVGSTAVRSALAHLILPGAVAAGTEGAAEELTRESLMRNPINLEQIAASAFTGVLWNGLANTLGYAIGKPLGFLRSKGGDLADWMERTGWHTPELKKSAVQSMEPHLSSITIGNKTAYEKGSEMSEHFHTETLDDIKASGEKKVYSQANIRKIEEDLNATQHKTVTKGKSPKAAADAAAAESAAAADAAAKAAAPVTLPPDLKPEDVRADFAWPKEYKKEHKKTVLTRMYKDLLESDPTHLQMWNETTRLAKEIDKYRKAVTKGDLDAAATAPVIDKLVREKEEYKVYLNEAMPRKIVDGNLVPGFKDLDMEYAKVSGNPYHDLQAPGFGAAIPKVKPEKLPRAKPEKPTIISETESGQFKRHRLDDEKELIRGTEKRSAGYRDFDHHLLDEQKSAFNKDKDEKKWSATFRFPKDPPRMDRVGIKQPFSTTDIAATLGVGALFPPASVITKPVAAYKGLRNAGAYMATHREAIGKVVGAVGDRLLKYGTPSVKATVEAFSERSRHKPYEGVQPVNVAHYQRAADVLNAAASNPEAVQSYIQAAYPDLNEAHPEAAAQIATTIIRGARMLNDTVPKRPYAPTLRDTQFKPPRAQQHRMLSRWQIIANPQMALRTGDPQTLQLLQEIYPAWYAAQAQALTNNTQAFRGPVMGHAARNITAFTGAAVNPINNAAALKRLQASAGPLPAQNAGQEGQSSPKIGGGPQSVKTANSAANRDDPSFELN